MVNKIGRKKIDRLRTCYVVNSQVLHQGFKACPVKQRGERHAPFQGKIIFCRIM